MERPEEVLEDGILRSGRQDGVRWNVTADNHLAMRSVGPANYRLPLGRIAEIQDVFDGLAAEVIIGNVRFEQHGIRRGNIHYDLVRNRGHIPRYDGYYLTREGYAVLLDLARNPRTDVGDPVANLRRRILNVR